MTAAAVLPMRFARLVKFEHTIFALPFAYVGAFLAVDGVPCAHDLLWITVAMVGARSLAMGLNRLIDAASTRATRGPRAASFRPACCARRRSSLFCLGSLAVFLVAVCQLDPLVRWLWPIPVVGFVIYPYLKRWTWLCHLWLGAVDGLAPIGAWVAITGHLPWEAWALGGAVAFWVAGFDLLLLAARPRLRPRAGAAVGRDPLRRARRVLGGAACCTSAPSRCWSVGLRLDVGVFYWLGVVAVAGSSRTSTRSSGRATCGGSTPRSSR